MEERRSSKRRWFLLMFWSLVCGGLSAIAAQLGLFWSLPPSDGANDSSPLEFLTHPIGLAMALSFVVPASFLGLIAARVFLWNTRLEITVPIVTAVSVLVCLLAGRLSFLVVVPALFAAFLTMVWCEEHFPCAGSSRSRARRVRT